MASSKINYRIKLISGSNVILIEADDYESEIFMPHIIKGRITFLNIIPNRRCCQLKTQHHLGDNIMGIKCETTNEAMAPPSKLSGMSSISSQQMRPLANSTPAAVGEKTTSLMRIKGRVSSILMTPNSFGNGSEFSLPTPEPIRKAVAPQRHLIENTLKNLPRGIKVMRLYHNSRDGTPSKVGRLVTSSNMGSITRENLNDISNLSCSFRIPSTPSSAAKGRPMCSTPLNKQTPVICPRSSNSKWRKCKTPIRTYSKRGAPVKRNPSLSSLKKSSKPVLPTYLVNPTQAPKPTHTYEVRRRKLVVDGKVRMSSRAMKRQNTAYQASQKPIVDSGMSYTILHKRRKTPMSAFDLLTNSNRSRCLSTKLNELFRRGCVNKASSTYNKYKRLCTIPPLQEDEQILELTQAQLPSFSTISAGQTSGDQTSSRLTLTTLSVPINTVAPAVLYPNARNHHPNLHNNLSKPNGMQQPVRYVLK